MDGSGAQGRPWTGPRERRRGCPGSRSAATSALGQRAIRAAAHDRLPLRRPTRSHDEAPCDDGSLEPPDHVCVFDGVAPSYTITFLHQNVTSRLAVSWASITRGSRQGGQRSCRVGRAASRSGGSA